MRAVRRLLPPSEIRTAECKALQLPRTESLDRRVSATGLSPVQTQGQSEGSRRLVSPPAQALQTRVIQQVALDRLRSRIKWLLRQWCRSRGKSLPPILRCSQSLRCNTHPKLVNFTYKETSFSV